MKRRLPLLLVPSVIVVVVLLVLDSCRPPAVGNLVLKDCKQLDISITKEPLHLDSDGLELLTELVIRNVPVSIEADRIQVEGRPNSEFRRISLEPLDEFQLSHDLPSPDKRKLTVTAEGNNEARLLLTHSADKQGFYCDFDTPNDCEFKIDYEPQAPELKLTAKGARIKNLMTEGVEEIATISKTQSLEVKLLSTGKGDRVSIGFATGPKGSNGFLSIRYKLPPVVETVKIFPENESDRLHINTQTHVSSAGTAQLFIDGKLSDEIVNVGLVVRGDNLRISHGIAGSSKGLATEIGGTFASIESVVNGGPKPTGVNTLDAAVASTPRLPSRLSKISTSSLILLGAIAYIIDKIVTIVQFLYPENKS